MSHTLSRICSSSLLFLISLFLFNRCSWVNAIGILNNTDEVVTLSVTFQKKLTTKEFYREISHSSNEYIENSNFFRVPANKYFSPDRFSTEKGIKIPIQEILYDSEKGEFRFELKPKFAYFFDFAINDSVNIMDAHFSKIEISSKDKRTTIQSDKFISFFPKNDNCNCFLLIYK